MLVYSDLETYSECPISRGAYRYAEDPSTEVLLWGYAVDDQPARVWDVTAGPMPEDLRAALKEVLACRASIVWHNGMNFDTNVLALNKNGVKVAIPRSQIIDTMVIAYQHGLPGALGDLCEVYRMPKDVAKDKDGRRLVQLFCKPHAYGRDDPTPMRFTKKERPEDWERFVNYCRLDVEAERALYKKLPRFNLTEAEHRLQLLDDEINHRGMLMDVDLARAAIDLRAEGAKKSRLRTAELTGGELDSTTRTQATIDYLAKRFGIELKNLQKAEVSRLIEDDSIPEPMRELLRIRLSSAKASVKKYQAILDCVNSDNRLRGGLQFRGASRTGRFCLTGDHEVLTPSGWVRLDRWEGGRIAIWNAASEAISFQNSEALKFPYSGPLYHIDTVRCDQLSTPDHRMPYWGRKGGWLVDTVQNLSGKGRFTIPFVGYRIQPETLEHDRLRVLIMVQADGHYTEDGQLIFQFKKLRKIQRCRMLLRRNEITFSETEYGGVTRISIHSRHLPLWLRIFRDKQYGYWLLNESADVIFDELPEWDGYRCGPNSIQYCTKVKANADLIQALACLSGRTATILQKKPANSAWSTCYVVNIWLTPKNRHEVRNRPTVENFTGTVYCASTPTGFFIVRRGGRVWVTGNSGRHMQPQNLPRQTLSPEQIEERIEETLDGSLLEFSSDPAGELAQCLRGTITVPKGSKMVVADYSNIEGRVLAWMAGEDWKLKAFRAYDAGTGPDLYKLTYSRAFNVPVETVTKAQRQMGKVLELAMGYGGGVGAFVTFARGYGVDLNDMAEGLKGVIPPEVTHDAERLYEWAVDNKRTGGLSHGVWVACDSVKRLWRAANAGIVSLWGAAGEACLTAVKEKGVRVPIALGGKVYAVMRGSWLLVHLPSGRFICYPAARIDESGASITYMGVNQYTRKWGRIETFAGKAVENLTQAVACDVLCHALPIVSDAGYKPILTVHDEILTEAPDTPEFNHKKLEVLMSTNPPWAMGLPLSADGFDSYRYHK